MAFGMDSSFRRLPVDLDNRQRVFCDAIRYSGSMATVAYFRLCSSLLSTTLEFSAKAQTPPFEPVFLDAWSFIDCTFRLSRLIQDAPGIKHRGPIFRIFEQRILGIEDLRHGIQHLSGETKKLSELNLPAFGVLSWACIPNSNANEGWICSILAGTVVKSAGHPMVNPKGKPFSPPVDHIEITAFGRTVSISAVFRAIEDLSTYMEQQLAEQSRDRPHFASDLCIGMQLLFKRDDDKTGENVKD